MSLEASKRSGFILRLLALAAFSLTLLFAALLVNDNRELQKLVPPSPFRSLSIMFGYIVALISFNYMMAVRGRNFMGWKVEAALTSGFICIFVSLFLPFAFPRESEIETNGLISFVIGNEKTEQPRWTLSFLIIMSFPLFFYSFNKLRSLDIWKRSW